ncbi:MAG: TIGR00341 family protein [Thermodesulfobacteriota bacterium]
MALRLIELYLPSSVDIPKLREQLAEFPVLAMWEDKKSDTISQLKIMLDSGDSGSVMDYLEKRFSSVKGFRIVLLSVEATLPRIEVKNTKKTENNHEKKREFKIGKGLSREELYNDISQSAGISGFFLFLVVLSTLVASVGILKDNVAVIIGAMVIAPLIGPNVAWAFSTTLGDRELFWRSIRSMIAGLAITLAISLCIGFLLHVDPTIPELDARTKVGIGDIVLALASGSAGALSFTMGLPSAIIGVMVAVALLPPAVSFGMLVGAGHTSLAFGSLLLLVVNVICVNLSAVATFLFQGVQPLNWWEANKAKKSTIFAIFMWSTLLIILTILIIKVF